MMPMPFIYGLLLLISCTNNRPEQAEKFSKNILNVKYTKGLAVPSINNSILGQWYVSNHIYLLNSNLNADEMISDRHNLNLCINSTVLINNNGIGADNDACQLSGYNFKTDICTARKLPIHEGSDYAHEYMGSEVADSNYMSVRLAWFIQPLYKGSTMTVLNTNCHFENTSQVLRICIADSNTIALLTYADLLVLKRNKSVYTYYPDTSISKKICLQNYKILEANFGDLMPFINRDEDLPSVYISNKTETQFVKLIFHPGSVKNSFDEFEVTTQRPAKFRKTAIVTFVTESGVKLGMSLSQFNSLKKADLIKTQNKTKITLTQRLEWPYIFLRGYNMPIYFSEYSFENEILTHFSFGFEYP